MKPEKPKTTNHAVLFDTVEKLGTFVEIEVIEYEGFTRKNEFFKQCRYYLNLFEISHKNLISVSYNDLLLDNKVILS